MFFKRVLVIAMLFAFVVSVYGCGGGGGDGGGSTSTSTSGNLSGTVADGLAMANAQVSIQSADGTVLQVGTTDGLGNFSGFNFPDTFKFPALLMVNRSNGGGVIQTIIPSRPGSSQITNINPITQAITARLLPTGTALKDLNVGTDAAGFSLKSKAMVETLFGTSVDYTLFASKTFKARTTTNATGGGLADNLVDTIS